MAGATAFPEMKLRIGGIRVGGIRVEHATRRILAATREQIRMIAALGADGVWIEECLTDQISPGMFQTLNLPLVQACVQEIRKLGM